ncbi:MAG: DUF3795 domain-containing protein [Candidatus Cloacimonadaceae bacterium]|nr:DUF3795 domain-containing protein [Candidatus Cloacimonadaceae bacterium]
MNNYMACCGLYCGACSSMIAHEKGCGDESAQKVPIDPDESPCPGCGSPGLEDCEFIVCNKSHGTECCAYCEEFPCEMIIKFNHNEYVHHSVVLSNLKRIQEIGRDAWLTEQKIYWSCKSCGARYHWYQANCESCGAIGNAVFLPSH